MPTKAKKKITTRFVSSVVNAPAKPVGRPKVVRAGRLKLDGRPEEEILSKLRDAWDLGASDAEACLSADVSQAWLYRFLNDNPLFREERDRRKEKLALMSRKVILTAIADGNVWVAQWYLERRKKDEFSKVDTMVNTQVNLQVPILLDTRINAGNNRREGE